MLVAIFSTIQIDNENRSQHELKSQSFIISSILLHVSSKTRSFWSKVQKNMPNNIINFTIKYLNYILTTKRTSANGPTFPLLHANSASNLKFSSTLCLVVSPTWKMAGILGVITRFFCISLKLRLYKSIACCTQIFLLSSASLITGDYLRTDLVLVLNSTTVYLLELAVGFESSIKINSERKSDKYGPQILALQEKYCNVKYINPSMSAFGIFGRSSVSFSSTLNDLHFDNTH